ncbi:methyl-accepting chemotaxis protein [Pseudomonas sp. C2L11]|nr:methyl-accepting chemotaxis protein [Pseudomonas typographi]MBD1551188.1 methyl-accepting chemotaxis protein [Pseudomonas typographi]
MNIKHKLTFAFATIACLPVIVIASLVIMNQREQAKDDFVDNSGREIRQIDNTMQQFFDGISQNVDFLARDPRIAGVSDLKYYLGADAASLPLTPNNQAMLSIFDSFAKTHPSTAYLSVGLQDGGYASWPDDPKTASYAPRKRPWYEAAMAAPGKTTRTGAYYWAPDDAVLIGTVHTVADPAGNVRGVVGLDVSLKQLTERVKSIHLGNSGYLMLTEADGNVLVNPANAQHTFKQLSTLGPDYAALNGMQQGSTEVTLGGVTYMANVVTSQSLGWHFIGLIQRDEVMAKAVHLTWLIVAIAAAMGLLFALAGASFAGVIVRPIRSVAQGLQDIAQGEGDLTRKLPVHGKDETAALAGWFNQFLGAIAQLVRSIGQAAGNLQRASGDASQVAHAMSDAALRQREAVELVSTAFNEMVATANEVARSCTQAASSADAGQLDVQSGQQHIDQATGSVSQLSGNLQQATQAMQVLEQDSRNINGILDTIRSIAEQTNLLALNAAIEAARAGDQGRGFAVVADEVRALARRTADSTGEIDTLLGNLARRTQDVTQQMHASLGMSQQSVERIQQARASFDKIRGSVDNIRDQNSQIATAAEEQHQVAEDINRHIAQIHTDAQKVEELAQTARADSQQLGEISGELNGLVGRFRY